MAALERLDSAMQVHVPAVAREPCCTTIYSCYAKIDFTTFWISARNRNLVILLGYKDDLATMRRQECM